MSAYPRVRATGIRIIVGAKRRCPASFLASASGSLAVVFFVMGVTGFFRYTTLGIDSDLDDTPFVYYRYWRIRWPGDGSFRMGGGAFRYGQAPNKPLEPFDLGGRFFLPPRHETAPSVWNRLGFRVINRTWDDERTRSGTSAPKPWEAWISVPCLLPAALFATPPLAIFRRRKQRAKISQ